MIVGQTAGEKAATQQLQQEEQDQGCYQRYKKLYNQKMLLIHDDVSFLVHGKRYKFSKNSLGLFSNRNPFRIVIVWIITWHVFQKMILILIIFSSISLGMKDYLDPQNLTKWNQWVDYFDTYFTVAFLIECLIKFIGMGMLFGKEAYLKDAWNWVDLIVVIASILEKYVGVEKGFRVFRLFRPLRVLKHLKPMQLLMETLFQSTRYLGGILGLAIFFFSIFAILGISQWRGLSHYRCRQTEFPINGDWLPVQDDFQLCQHGQRKCPVGWCGSLLERQDNFGDLYAVKNLYRDNQIHELNHGVTNFDHLGSALLTIFQCITMEGWTKVMYMYQDAADPTFVKFYFMSCVVICSFFLLNMTIAVMLMKYVELEQKNSNSAQNTYLRRIGEEEANLPFALTEFILTQTHLTIGKKAIQKLNEVKSKKQTLCQKLLKTEYIPKAKQIGYFSYRVPQFCFVVAQSNLFGIVVTVCIVLNTLALSLERYPLASEEESNFCKQMNVIFNAVFQLQQILKIVGLGLRGFAKRPENLLDLAVVSLSWVEISISSNGISLTALRAMRLFPIFRMLKHNEMRILLDTIVMTISQTGPYILLLTLFLYVFSLIGMNFFAGKMYDYGQSQGNEFVSGEVPRANFESFQNAVLTTFSCFVGDGWTSVMDDAMRSNGSSYALFFVFAIVCGNIVLPNLFLAILLGNFERARDFGGKKKLLKCFTELRKAGHDLSQCIDWILEDTAEHIKIKVLKWDRKLVEAERLEPNSFMRSILAHEEAKFMQKFDYEVGKDPYDDNLSVEEQDNDSENFEGSSIQTGARSRGSIQRRNFKLVRLRSEFMNEFNEQRIVLKQESANIQVYEPQKPKILIGSLDENNTFTSKSTFRNTISRKALSDPAVIGYPKGNIEAAADDAKEELIAQQPFDESAHSLDQQNDSRMMALQMFQTETEKHSIKEDEFYSNQINTNFQGRRKTEGYINRSDSIEVTNQLLFLDNAVQQALQSGPESDRVDLLQRGKSDDTLGFDSTQMRRQSTQRTSLNPFKSCFSKSKKNKGISDKTLMQSKTEQKVLKPCCEHVRRTNEIQNLDKLIEDSHQYFVKDSDYCEHTLRISAKDNNEDSQRSNDLTSLKIKIRDQRHMTMQLNLRDTVKPRTSSFTSKQALARAKTLATYINVTSNQAEQFSESKKLNCLQKYCNAKCRTKAYTYMSESSLLIFHRDSRIRNWCIKLLISEKLEKQAKQLPENDEEVVEKEVSNITKRSNHKSILKVNDMAPRSNKKSVKNQSMAISLRTVDSGFETGANQIKLQRTTSKKEKQQKRKSIRSRKISMEMREAKAKQLADPISAEKNGCKRCLLKCLKPLQKMTPNQWFENIILLLILTSSIILVIDTPLVDPNSAQRKILTTIDVVHTVLFTLEMVVKIIGLGFFTNSLNDNNLRPYIRSEWNVLDFFVVMTSLIELLMQLSTTKAQTDQLKSLKSLRALRAFRPLRVVQKNEGMKLVVGALMTSIPTIANVSIVSTLLLLMMAIMGVNLFKGAFYSCVGLSYEVQQMIDTKQDCLDAGGSWKNQDMNFDNVFQAMVTQFQMMTTEGWQRVMYNGIDATGIDMQPKKNFKPIMAVYFIVSMIIGSQFIINLFVGVIIDNFNKVKESDEMGNNFVTKEQKQWIEIQRVCLSKSLIKELSQPKGYQIVFNKITNSKIFEIMIIGCIITNTVLMALVHYRQPDQLTLALDILNYVFAGIFTIEMILKLLAEGKNYFRQGWNVFDCLIVSGTNIGILINFIGSEARMGPTTSIIRAFRIIRIFRLSKASISIQLLIDALLNILPQIMNIICLMLIVLFIYAALGLNLFSEVMLQKMLNDKNNFQTFGNAIVLLMRCATGEDWNLIMQELANQEGYKGVACRSQTFEEQQEQGILGCGKNVSFFYFFSFVMLMTMLIMNLAVAAVIQGLKTACLENLGIVSSDDLDNFISLWKQYDPQATGWISAENLVYLLCELQQPIGRRKDEMITLAKESDSFNEEVSQDRYLVHKEKKIVLKKVQALAILQDNLKIKIYKSDEFGIFMVHYKHVIKGLLKRILVEKNTEFRVNGEIALKLKSMWAQKHNDLEQTQINQKNLLKQLELNQLILTAAHHVAACTVQNWFFRKRSLRKIVEPDIASTAKKGETDKFKEAQRTIAETIFEANNGRKHQSSKPFVESAKEQQALYDTQEHIAGGVKILAIINAVQNRKKDPRKMNRESHSQILSPTLHGKRQKVRKTAPTEKPPNMRENDSFTWNDIKAVDRLYQEVLEEEKRLELLCRPTETGMFPLIQAQRVSSNRQSESSSSLTDQSISGIDLSEGTHTPQKNNQSNESQDRVKRIHGNSKLNSIIFNQ